MTYDYMHGVVAAVALSLFISLFFLPFRMIWRRFYNRPITFHCPRCNALRDGVQRSPSVVKCFTCGLVFKGKREELNVQTRWRGASIDEEQAAQSHKEVEEDYLASVFKRFGLSESPTGEEILNRYEFLKKKYAGNRKALARIEDDFLYIMMNYHNG